MESSPKTPPFARHHPAICLAPGLFESLANGARADSRERVALANQTLDGAEHVFEGAGPLGMDDLRVLQGVYMLASQPSANVELEVSAPRSETGRALADLLSVRAAPGVPTLAKFVTFNVAALAEAAGYGKAAGGTRTIVAASLRRLAEVEVAVVRDGVETLRSRMLASTPLVDGEACGPRHNSALALSPALSTTVITGVKGVRHCRIESVEIAALGRSGAARALHQRLCAFVDPGKTHRVSLKTLAGYAFGETDVENTSKRRLGDIRSAMETLAGLPGWKLTHDGVEGKWRVYMVSRPKAAVPPKP